MVTPRIGATPFQSSNSSHTRYGSCNSWVRSSPALPLVSKLSEIMDPQLPTPDSTVDQLEGISKANPSDSDFIIQGWDPGLCVCDKLPGWFSHATWAELCLEEEHKLCYELHLTSGVSFVLPHLTLYHGGGDSGNCESHPGCRLELPGDSLIFWWGSFAEISI